VKLHEQIVWIKAHVHVLYFTLKLCNTLAYAQMNMTTLVLGGKTALSGGGYQEQKNTLVRTTLLLSRAVGGSKF
jgi:hypothetical protein